MRYLLIILLFIAGEAGAQQQMFHAHNQSPAIVTTNLAFWIDAGNPSSYPGSGTTITDIVGGNNGTLTAGVTFSSDGGGSLVIGNGSGDFINSTGSSYGGTAVSLEIWVYIAVSPTGGVPFYNGNSASNGYGLFVSDGACAAGTGMKILASGVSCDGFPNSHVITAGVWSHYVFTFNSGLPEVLYYNGSSVASGSIVAFASPSGGWRIDLPGKHAVARVYNATLTSTQVLQNFNAERSRFGL